MHRRRALQVVVGSVTASLVGGRGLPAADRFRSGLGIVTHCRSLLQRRLRQAEPPRNLFEPLTFLRHADELGAAGVQAPLGILEPPAARELRRVCEQRGMFLESDLSLPKTEAEVDRFRAEMESAAAAGARAARCVILPGRRYEQFQSREAFEEADRLARRAVERAAPIAEQLRLPLAIENHKDHRNSERLRLLESLSSEYVGACVDTGNSVALLEDPLETVRAFAPWAHAVHFKDQAVQPYAEGFLLGDIPLGQGCFDLATMVRILREARPGLPMCLELITRDPLQVPCLTEAYWSTFPDLPARDLARTLRLVRDQAAAELQSVSSRTPEEQVALEEQNVRHSLQYARETLGL